MDDELQSLYHALRSVIVNTSEVVGNLPNETVNLAILKLQLWSSYDRWQ
jgi:hypothetical protein